MSVNPSNIKTNCNSLLINSMNDNNLTSNNFDFQNSKPTEPFIKNVYETSVKTKKTPI